MAYGQSKQLVAQSSYLPRRTTTSQSSRNSLLRRSSSVWNFTDQDLFPVYKLGYLPSVPLHQQESMLVSELIYCMVGVRGMYIVPAEGSLSDDLNGVRFNISDKIDVSLKEMVNQVIVNSV